MMKRVKVSGLAVVLAMTITTLVAAGSASATELCKVAPSASNQCSTGQNYTTGAKFTATSAKVTLTMTPEDIQCHSAVTFEQTGTGGGAGVSVPMKATALSFSSCQTQPNGLSCTINVLGLPYVGSIAATSSGKGSLTVNKVEWTMSCPFTKCIYTVSPVLAVNGGSAANIVGSEIKLTHVAKEGFLECAKEAKMDATYSLTSPTNLWVATEMD